HGAIGVPTEVLIVPDGYAGTFSAELVAEALQQGPTPGGHPAQVSTLADPDYDSQMRAARAVITGMGRLERRSLVGTLLSEVATRARQAGVPCHAVVGYNGLSLFDMRILDLQLLLEATTLTEIE